MDVQGPRGQTTGEALKERDREKGSRWRLRRSRESKEGEPEEKIVLKAKRKDDSKKKHVVSSFRCYQEISRQSWKVPIELVGN